MPRREHPRKAEALALLADGQSVVHVARVLHIDRSTVWRWGKLSPPLVVQEPEPDAPDAGTDWGELGSEAVEELRRMAANGSVPAARELLKLADRNGAVVEACSGHFTVDHVQRLLTECASQFTAQRGQLAMVIGKRFGLEEHEVLAAVEDWLETRIDVLNRLHGE